MTGTNEERIISFVEKELTENEERSLMDECANSDEMRSLLKQHVTLSKRISSTLSAVAVPISATDKVNEAIAQLRGTPVVPKGMSKAAIFSAVGAVLVIVAGLTYTTITRHDAASVVLPTASQVVLQLPPAPVMTQQVIPPPTAALDYTQGKVPTVHHRLQLQGIDKNKTVAAQQSAPQAMKDEPAVNSPKHKSRHIEALRDKDKVAP